MEGKSVRGRVKRGRQAERGTKGAGGRGREGSREEDGRE